MVLTSATVALSVPTKLKKVTFCAQSTLVAATASIELQYGPDVGAADGSMSIRLVANIEVADRTVFEDFMCSYLEVVAIQAGSQLVIEVE
jgi:hypothetical protein